MILKDVCFNNREKSIWLLPPVLKLLLYPSYHIFSALFLFACDLWCSLGSVSASQL